MQLPEISNTAVSNVVRLADGTRKTRVLYAGDMEFAKAQFASVAPQLHLVPVATVLTNGANGAPASGEIADVTLIDCGAAGVDPRAIVDALRARGLDLPIVLAVDPAGSEQAPTRVTAELRVDDYTVKLPGWLARLTSRLEFAIAHHRRRRSLEALQASSERLRTVVESAPVCLARVARDGTILAMNAAAMKMVSAETPEDILGKSLLSFVDSGGADNMRRFLDAVSAGQPGSLEFETADVAGATRVVDTRAVPLAPDPEGRPSALLVLRDATERKRLEESVLAAADGSSAAAADVHAEESRSLRHQLDAALEECRQVQAERDALRGEAEEARARASMIEHVRAACTTAEQQLGEIQATYQRTLAERDTLAEDLATARVRHDAALAEYQTDREKQQERIRSAEAERADLVSRCDALQTLVTSIEARQAAERDEHRAAREQAEAEIRRLTEATPLTAEREGLLASLATLRAQFDEMSASLDAAEARHAADLRTQLDATASVEARLREVDETRALVAAQRDELRVALDAAHAQTAQMQSALEELRARHDAAIEERDAIRTELRGAAQTADGRSEQLQTTLDELRARHDSHLAERDAQLAEAKAIRRTLAQHVEELQARLNSAHAERDAMCDELRAAVGRADSRTGQLQAALDEIRAARDTQAAESDAIRRELLERIDELQSRVHASLAERDAVQTELRLALDAAEARSEQLRVALDEMRAGRDLQAAEGDAVRHTLTRRVEELQMRLDAVMIDRETLERTLEDVRAEQAARLQDAAVAREALQRRLEERDVEYAGLCAQHAALQAWRERQEADALAAAQALAATEATTTEPPAQRAAIDDAQAAFREAFQLLSGELQTAVEATRAQHAALLRSQPAGYDLLEDRLRQAESECRRLTAERDERTATARALQDEIEQLMSLRREQRKELVRALKESDETERRAAARLAESARLRQMLAEAQTALQRLSTWAANQSVRLGSPQSGAPRPVRRIEAQAAGSGGRDDAASSANAGAEGSWS